MVGTQERFAKDVYFNDPADGRPESNCNATGRYLLWAVNGVTYRWERTPVAHMVYYDIRPESLTEKRGYFKVKKGDVIDIVIQNYPACNKVYFIFYAVFTYLKHRSIASLQEFLHLLAMFVFMSNVP